MSKAFCLLDERWLPVRLSNGSVVEMGLLEVFARSSEIVALAETAPPNLVAQYRMLLAITHRALTRAFSRWDDEDRARWYQEGLPVAEIHAYLEHWRERFWLFHPEFPFMQVAALAFCEETRAIYPPGTISVELFFGKEMFNQEIYQNDAWPAGRSIRSLLGYLQFVPGGFFPGKKLKVSEKAGALVNTAAILPVGRVLSETLCMALHPHPIETMDEDLPAWERPVLSIADLRQAPLLASGQNDRYTRQSRAVLFIQDEKQNVAGMCFAAGLSLAEDPNAPDPMASFFYGSKGLVRLSFDEARALWRDLPTLLPNPSKSSQSASVLNYAINLHQCVSFDAVFQQLLVAGLASDQAKLLRWRSEQISLPTSLLLNSEKALYLRQLVSKAEGLFDELRRLAANMQANVLPDSSSKDTRARARSLIEASSFAASYFAEAERALPKILGLIDEYSLEKADLLWRSTLRTAALRSWRGALR